ncbi:MAG TPA: biotin carboxylase N-terminal domain-containing protein [Propylenella sp.]|nr:biotin carboxylase N-terminal domain-containing protein [Propylenella sp.]
MLKSLLIANRGEIARRIIRTARRMGIRTVAVYTEADRSWPHWREADEAVLIGTGPAGESYLSIERILEAVRRSGADSVHPGYGFLSENAGFAEACAAAGLIFVGPPPQAIRAMGSKAEAKTIMARAGVPVVPGYNGERQDPEFLKQKAYETGYPVLIKATAGGGGRGMRRVDRALDFDAGLAAAKREALAAFGDERVIVERYVLTPRHIEVQVFGDAHGNIVHLFERDCSVQRRHQKVVEEAPAPGLPDEVRRAMGEAAVMAAAAVGYRSAGTVEFIADASHGLRREGFFFMEMNTRLQVEHPVTEAVTGIDLVEWQLRVAAGEPLPLRQDQIASHGHSIEARLYAEDPAAGFRPSTGRLWAASFSSGVGIRVDSGVQEGSVVGPYYDSMLAKIITAGETRAEALQRLGRALAGIRIAGPRTNLSFLSSIVSHPDFLSGGVDTGFVENSLGPLGGRPSDPGVAAGAVADWAQREAQRYASEAPGPWCRLDGFELGGLERRTSLDLIVEGEQIAAQLRWTGNGPEIASIGEMPPAGFDGEVVWGDRDAFLLRAGHQIRVGFPDPLARQLDAGRAGGEVTAPMHGRVVTLAVASGEIVEKGDLLFTLEAMKMEHTVVAPVSGTVQAVRIAAGQQVEQGAPAISIAAAEQARPVD